MKIMQSRHEIIKIRVSTFWMSEKSTDSRRRPTQPPRQVGFKPITAFQTSKNPKICMDLAPGGPNPCMHTKRGPFPRYLAALAAKFIEAAPLFAIFGRASGQILIKMRVLARQGHYSSHSVTISRWIWNIKKRAMY